LEEPRYFDSGKLVVFRRTSKFTARSRLPDGKYVWRSLGTADLERAKSEAWKFHHRVQERHAEGLPVKTRSFRAVIDEYVAFRTTDNERGNTSAAMLRQIVRVSKFWVSYAGKKPIDRIGDVELRGYVEWRRSYYSRLPGPLPKNAKLNPTDKTIQWELTLAKSIVKWAHERGYRGKAQLPTYAFTAKLKRVRPAFEFQEYQSLLDTLWARVVNCPSPDWRTSRELLRDYVLILANTGIRVGEANNLKIRDVALFEDDLGRKNYRLLVKGKTGEREVIARTTAAKHIERRLQTRSNSAREEFAYFDDDGDLVAYRFRNWKAVFMEQKKPGGFPVWYEPLTEYRIPKLFNLRMDPFERADVVSNQYDQWRIENAYLMGEVTFHAAAFLDTFKEYPPSQRPASFSIDQVRRNVDKVIDKSFRDRGLE
jgi:integrase